jgi:hypothetical protein
MPFLSKKFNKLALSLLIFFAVPLIISEASPNGTRELLAFFFVFVSLAGLIYVISRDSPRAAKPTTLKAPPSWRLRDLAQTAFSRKTYAVVFEPMLRDLYDEYCDALKEGLPWKVRWVCIRGYWSFWSAVFTQMPISVLKMVYKIWRATR